MLELANTRTQHASVEWAQLGPGGAWFLLFTDGAYFWGGNIGSNMQEDLDSAKNQQGIHRLYMASEDCDKYLLEFGDGTTSWCMSDGFTWDYKVLPEAIDNGYYKDQSQQEHGDHHIWRHKTTGDVIEYWRATQTVKTTVKAHPRDASGRSRGNAWKDMVRDNIDPNGLVEIFRNIRVHSGKGRYHHR
jgi:hypothetical protein